MEKLLTKEQTEKLIEARTLIQNCKKIVEGVLAENHDFFITANGQVLDKAVRQSAYSLELLTIAE